jgi:hypothetical protein
MKTGPEVDDDWAKTEKREIFLVNFIFKYLW